MEGFSGERQMSPGSIESEKLEPGHLQWDVEHPAAAFSSRQTHFFRVGPLPSMVNLFRSMRLMVASAVS